MCSICELNILYSCSNHQYKIQSVISPDYFGIGTQSQYVQKLYLGLFKRSCRRKSVSVKYHPVNIIKSHFTRPNTMNIFLRYFSLYISPLRTPPNKLVDRKKDVSEHIYMP